MGQDVVFSRSFEPFIFEKVDVRRVEEEMKQVEFARTTKAVFPFTSFLIKKLDETVNCSRYKAYASGLLRSSLTVCPLIRDVYFSHVS